MESLIEGKNSSATVDSDGPLVMIGEKINPTGRKKLAAAFTGRDLDYVIELAIAQVEAGADILDVNVGVPGEDETKLLPEVISVVTSAVDVPICIDSPNRDAIEAALKACPGRPLINSVNGEEASMQRILPLAKHYGASVIGLTLDEDGIPEDAAGRFTVARKIIDRADSVGVPLESIIIDPLVLTVGADSNAARVTLDTIALLRAEYGVNINLGASNVSFGLPERHTLNQAFLATAMSTGASCAITDVAKLGATARATDLLLGRDNHGARYIKHYRRHAKTDAD